MHAGFQQFTKFISGEITLVIPVYQRNYDWKTVNCEQLFNDTIHIIENGKPHFIGTFVYQFKPIVGTSQEYIIIDGQQRITSIILFAKALYDLTDDENLKRYIRARFIKHDTGIGIENKCRLRPNKYDEKTFEKLMRDDVFNENNFDEQEKSSVMYLNYLIFREKILASPLTKEKIYTALCELTIVSILLDGENPQEIFESLNSTGLDLSQADLIRNFLLMPLPYDLQKELYDNYWFRLEGLLRPSGNVENFFVQYLITKRRSNSAMMPGKQSLNSKNLYGTFKKFFDENFKGDAETCLKDLLRYANFFHRTVFNDDTNFKKLSPLDKKFYELVNLLDADNAPIILMYLLDRYEQNHFDEANFIKFVDALISLTFRAKICGNSVMASQFAGNVIARLDKEKNSLDEKFFWSVITFGKGRYTFPKDKDFQTALVNNKIYEKLKGRGCKYLLYSLEKQAKPKELPPYSEATVEHIWPQSLTDAWQDYLKTHDDSQAYKILLHTLGNLTLTAYNSELGNAPFDKKKEIYLQSSYPYTRALANYSEWTSKQIQTRAQKLAAEAIKIWILPKEYNSVLPNTKEFFNLDSDFALFTHKKPATLSIAGTEKNFSNWNELVLEIMQQLYKSDKDIFRKAVQMENVPRGKNLFSSNQNNFTQFIKIDNELFMDSKFDTKTFLRVVKIILENFEKLGGENFSEDIYFTLK